MSPFLVLWGVIRIYDKLAERLSKIADKIYKSFNKFLKDRIFMQFQNVMDAVPAEFSNRKRGNSKLYARTGCFGWTVSRCILYGN